MRLPLTLALASFAAVYPAAAHSLKTMPNVAIYMSLYDIVKLQLRNRASAQ